MRPRTAKRPPQALIDRAIARGLPTDRWVTFQLKRTTCGKPNCGKCRNGIKHGPYWRAYYTDDELNYKSFHVGKDIP
jgi:hypothetical protein